MALARIDLRGHVGPLKDALPRRADPGADVRQVVAGILDRVRREGDDAVRSLTFELDGIAVDDLRVGPDEVEAATGRVPAALRDALELAHRRITDYHAHSMGSAPAFSSDGVTVRDLVRPVERAGCYAPGGRARYPSTVLMCAAAARVAGVPEVVLCTPPGPDGRIDDATLAAAMVSGVDEVYRIGGAQAVAAMAYGTESVAEVDVIAGPGNAYVAEAKRQVSGVVGVASAFAGPSEVVVVAGPDTPARLAAVDLVVQAEHGPDGLAWLVTWAADKAAEVEEWVDRIVSKSPRQTDLMATLGTGGHVCLVDGPEAAMEVANALAPEHLELMWDGAEEALRLVRSAGAVFVGPWAPASLGDYVAGPNHVLPTNRSARFASALRSEDFVRHVHAVSVDPSALGALGPAVITLATVEGLPAHADSIRMRMGEG
jgi:histidinol dehydrogenase